MYTLRELLTALGIDPTRYDGLQQYRVSPAAAIAAAADSAPIATRIRRTCVLYEVRGQPDDGTDASFAGLEVKIEIAGSSLAIDNGNPGFIPLMPIVHPSCAPWRLETPYKLIQGADILTTFRNRTAGSRTPTILYGAINLKG